MKKNEQKVRIILLQGIITTGIIAGAMTLLFAFKPAPQNTAWVAPPTAEKEKNPIAANATSIAAGQNIYKKSCNDCHGKRGKGDGPKSAELDKNPQDFTKADFQKQSDGALYWKITEGKKPMPSFKHDLTKDQRWQVINYIRTLK